MNSRPAWNVHSPHSQRKALHTTNALDPSNEGSEKRKSQSSLPSSDGVMLLPSECYEPLCPFRLVSAPIRRDER